jgi:hypothetical protein
VTVVQSAPPVGVVFFAPQATTMTALRRNAEAGLLVGRETLIHWHVNQADMRHSSCEMYVLDWHEDDEYRTYKQIAVIAPPAVV